METPRLQSPLADKDYGSDSLIQTLREELQALRQESAAEKESTQETIQRKNLELNTQRVKLKQYEFALQEALVFLSKPLDKYQEWINSETPQDLQFEFPQMLGGRSARYSIQKSDDPGHPAQKSKSAIIPETHHAKTASVPISTVERSRSLANVGLAKTQDMTKLEISCMESMRLCFNFLRSCQKQNEAIDHGTYQIPVENPSKLVANESLALLDIPPALSALSAPPATPSNPPAPTPRKSIDASQSALSSVKIPPGRTYVEDTAGDLSLEPLDDFKVSLTTKPSCERCHQSFLLLDNLRDKLKTAETKTIELETRLQKEIAARKICQQAKDMIDQEIEEITAELFARANQMVVEESRRMDNLATANRELSKKVSDFASRLKEKETELASATKALYEFQSLQAGRAYDSTATEKPLVERKESLVRPAEAFMHSIFSGFDQFGSSIAADGYIFQEFQDLVKVMVSSATLPSVQAYQAIHSTLFMKRCMIESVEPCLMYTYAPTTAFKTTGNSNSLSFKKKLLDCAIKGHIVVNHVAADSPDSPAVSVPKAKCLLCTIVRSCEYKITVGDGVKPEPCCRFCRDRVLTVQDFFNLITFLSVGKHGLTIVSTFRQVLWTRRRMAMAVIGSCSLFETESSAILGLGTGGNWEKLTKPMY
ncbi:hypothetical protein HDV03_002730 [Kappamyces sp. JEL0829]|nr:hypothetical protein HDV03_002730 [Kappamyces sp. JEL0829]